MRLAVSAGGAPENVAYVQVLLGDLELQRGRVRRRAAGLHLRAAIAAGLSRPAMVGLARADAAGGDLGRAAVRLRRAAERLPLTSTLNLLSQAERAPGSPGSRGGRTATPRGPQQGLYRAAKTAPDAEAVLFEADHGSPAAAVALGRRVWRAAPSVRSADALGLGADALGAAAGGLRLCAGAPWRSAPATRRSGCTPA